MLEPTQRKFSPEEHAQLAALQQRQAGRDLDARLTASEIALRQWCVEQATKALQGAPNTVIMGPAELDEKNLKPGHLQYARVEVSPVVFIAQDILDFVTAPLKPEVPK
jgi:hypothetical protein